MSKILIIEDEATIVDLISFNLKREGFTVEAAYDGVDGLRKALKGDADLILLDVMLPGMNGFDPAAPDPARGWRQTDGPAPGSAYSAAPGRPPVLRPPS